MTPLHIGLGEDKLTKVEIIWGSGDPNPQIVQFQDGKVNESIVIERVLSEEVAVK